MPTVTQNLCQKNEKSVKKKKKKVFTTLSFSEHFKFIDVVISIAGETTMTV